MRRKPPVPPPPPPRLSGYPYVVVRIRCDLCHRAGEYRLARLAQKFGAETTLADLMDQLAGDCPWRRPPWMRQAGKYEARCHARFPDVDTTRPPPPDLPPGMCGLRVIEGGRTAAAAENSTENSTKTRKLLK